MPIIYYIVQISQQYTFRFKEGDSGRSESVNITGQIDRTKAYESARNQLLKSENVDIREFESNWDLYRTEYSIGVTETPSPEELDIESTIKRIDGVEKVKMIEDESENNTYYIQTQDIINEEYIIDSIKRYIQNQEVEGMESILFVINPQYYNFE